MFCSCSILDILRTEARLLEGLHNLGIKGEHQGKLLRLPVNSVDDSYALDIRHPAIMVSPIRQNDSSGPSVPLSDQLCRCSFHCGLRLLWELNDKAAVIFSTLPETFCCHSKRKKETKVHTSLK